MAGLADAYSATGAAWQAGPGRIYDRLAEAVVAELPEPVAAGDRVLDVGAGTGAATRALRSAGAQVVASDLALGMLLAMPERPPSVVADARHLPFADSAFAAVVAAFALNHLSDPAVALRDAVRVLRPGGAAVVSAYAADDDHPAKRAVAQAAEEVGWQPPEWVRRFYEEAAPRLATVERAHAVLGAAGVQGEAHRLDVAFPDLDVDDLVAWRLGMAQLAPFVERLPVQGRARLRARALQLLGDDPPTLVRRSVVLVARAAD